MQANLEAKAAVLSAKAQVEQAQLNLEFTRITSPIDGIASIAKGQIGDLVGPATGELTTVSTIDPIKAYYNVTEQAYINFTKLFSTETDRAERLKQLEIELILADGTVYPPNGQNLRAGPADWHHHRSAQIGGPLPQSGQRASPRRIRAGAGEV